MAVVGELLGATVGEVSVPVLLKLGGPEGGRVLISGLTNEQSWVVLGLLVVGGVWLVIWLWRAGDR